MPVLYFLPVPAENCRPYLVASTALQCLYYFLLAKAYQLSEFSLTYPLMRGSAPLLVALISTIALDIHLPPTALAGISAIGFGVISMIGRGRALNNPAVLPVSMLNAAVIAAYTLIDGIGINESGSPASDIGWLLCLTGGISGGIALHTRRAAFVHYMVRRWQTGILGSVGSVGSYGIALWAMTTSPIAVVAALRETSVLFSALIAWKFLHEKMDTKRLCAIGTIAIGVMLLKLE